MLLIKILIAISSLIICDSASILAVFPVPSISHYIAFRPFVEELAKRGHELTVITADPAYPEDQTPANFTEIDVHFETYSFRASVLSFATGKEVFSQINPIFQIFVKTFDVTLKSKKVQNLLRDKTKKFDLLILEACMRSTLSLQHVYKAPVIQISSFGSMEFNNHAFGSATHPILYPTALHQRLFNLNLWEKIVEIFKYYYVVYLAYYYENLEDKMLRNHFPELPPLSELSNNVDMLFLNVNPIWEMNRPVPPNVIHLGGLQLKPTKELPEDLKSYLDSSKNGVVYVSFGTNVDRKQIPEDVIAVLMRGFSQLPYTVLFKWETDEVAGRPSNVKICKWFPQADLLRHPKIKLFITQGGLQSTEEAIAAGVPLVGVPMLGDQWSNVEKYIYHKIGVKLDITTINADNLKNAVTTVIGDESYRRNILKLRSVMVDQPQSSLERGVWWAEYLLRHGNAKHLRSPAKNMPWSVYLQLDVVLVVFIVVLVVLVLVVFALYSVIKAVRKLLLVKEKVH